MNFEQWLVQVGKAESTAMKYARAIDGSISNWAMAAGLIDVSLTDLESTIQLGAIINSIQNLNIFLERDSKGNGM
jgi:hypothetical protein